MGWSVQEFVCTPRLQFVCGYDSVHGNKIGMDSLLSQSLRLELQRNQPTTRGSHEGIVADIASLVACRKVWSVSEGMGS